MSAEPDIWDQLTGVLNGRQLVATLEAQLEQAARSGQDLHLLLLDLDHFAWVNLDHHYLAGDRMLIVVAATLTADLAAADTVGRLRGGAFVVLLPGVTHEQMITRAQALRRACAAIAVPSPTGPVRRTVSIGVSSLGALQARRPEQQVSAQALLDVAEEALYAAKEGGRDRVVVDR